jgi:eukaryotic-like serine/threonine-protein kinase
MMRQGSLCNVVTRSGLILDDRYRLDERIAAGGVGQVWRATDLLLERPVAVKVLRPEYSDHPETLERFRKEAKNAGALSNSHVAQVYDYGPSGPDGSPYLVMEFVDGPSLADILAVDPIEPARALDVIAQAAEGLAAAHKAGVIHRDIKPGNILISMEGQVKVTDFGIAHAAGQVPVTSPGLVMGTTQYMAPERIAGNQGTAASDLYALGIVLHECLTGMPPHDGTAAEVMAAHLYLPLPPLPADVPPELDVLVDRLTTKDPAKRISDARELAELAARIRDSMGGGTFVPLARGAVQSGPGAAVPGPAPRSAAFAAEPATDWAGAGGQAGAVSPHGGMTPNTAVLYAPEGWTDPTGYVSSEWNVPPRMSLPTPPPAPPGGGHQDRPGGNPRKRGKGLAIGAVSALAVSAGLVAVLASGAFNGAPAANQTSPRSSATSGAATSQVPSSGPSSRSAPASGGVLPSSTATTGTTSPRATTGGKKPSTSPSAHPRTSSPASPTGGGGSSGGGSGAPTSTPSTGQSGTSAPTQGGSPSPSPSSCVLGICF